MTDQSPNDPFQAPSFMQGQNAVIPAWKGFSSAHCASIRM
jgi:hypothetical protein